MSRIVGFKTRDFVTEKLGEGANVVDASSISVSSPLQELRMSPEYKKFKLNPR